MVSRAKGFMWLTVSAFLFAAIVALVPTAAKAEEDTTGIDSTGQFEVDTSTGDDSTIYVTKYIGKETNIIIPAKINYKDHTYNTVINSTGTDKFFENSSHIKSFSVESGVTAQSLSHFFDRCDNLETVTFSNLDTSKVTDMSYMFKECDITSLDLSNLNTSNVTNMSGMFSDCSSLEKLEFGGLFDTSNVTNMSEMFWYCGSLTNLDYGEGYIPRGSAASA